MYIHSSPLSLAVRYVDVAQTVLVMLTMAGLFPYRPLSVHTHTHSAPHPYFFSLYSVPKYSTHIDDNFHLLLVIFPLTLFQ